MQTCIEVYITDKTGKRFFKTLCASEYTAPEVRNLTRKLDQARQHPKAYSFMDLESAKIELQTVTIP